MIGGVSVHPDEAEAFIQEIEGEQVEAEERDAESEQEQAEVESFSQSTTQVLDDLDACDLANAVNLAVDGQLDDSNIAKTVSSLGFSSEESALEVGRNLIDSMSEQFQT